MKPTENMPNALRGGRRWIRRRRCSNCGAITRYFRERAGSTCRPLRRSCGARRSGSSRSPVSSRIVCAIAVKLLFNQYFATATVLFDPRNAKVTGAQEVLPEIGPDSIAIESLVQVAKSDGFLSALDRARGIGRRSGI